MFSKLNVHSVFAYFFQLTIPVAGRTHSYYLNAFCLCLLARYFLVRETVCINRRVCWVVSDLSRGNLVGMILANSQWLGCSLLEGSKLLCRESSPSSGIIPNFCLDS